MCLLVCYNLSVPLSKSLPHILNKVGHPCDLHPLTSITGDVGSNEKYMQMKASGNGRSKQQSGTGKQSSQARSTLSPPSSPYDPTPTYVSALGIYMYLKVAKCNHVSLIFFFKICWIAMHAHSILKVVTSNCCVHCGNLEMNLALCLYLRSPSRSYLFWIVCKYEHKNADTWTLWKIFGVWSWCYW